MMLFIMREIEGWLEVIMTRSIVRAAGAALFATALTFPGRITRKNVIGLLAGLALIGGTGQVAAATMQVTYTGTVLVGMDQVGMFGTAGANLAGVGYTAVYIFDTTKGFTASSSGSSFAFGGSVYPIDSPALSAMLTINGQSVDFVGDYYGEIQGNNGGTSSTSRQHHDAVTNSNNNFLRNEIFSPTPALPASITTSFSYTVLSGDSPSGFFTIIDFNHAWGNLRPEALTVLEVSATTVPGPIVGAGLPGLALALGGSLLWCRQKKRRSSRKPYEAHSDAHVGIRIGHFSAA